MSTPTFNTKPESVDNVEKRRKYTVCIVGCGHIGLVHACLFAEAGFNVTCTDMNQAVINNLAKGKTLFSKQEIEPILRKHIKGGLFRATNDIKTAVTQSNIIVITTQATVDEKGKVSYSDLENTCKLVGASLQKGALVIITSVVEIGMTEGLIRETLESVSGFKVGVDLGLAYSPLQIFDEPTLEKSINYNRIVVGVDKNSLESATTILEAIIKKEIIKVEDVKTAEAATLFKALKHQIELSLANEIAIFCEKAGIDYFNVQKLAKTSTNGELVNPTLDCEKNYLELQTLLEEAENISARLQIPSAAREVNKEFLKHAISLIRESLRSSGKTLRRAQIALLGVSQTPNTVDTVKASTRALAKMLDGKGAKIRLYDPYFSSGEHADFEYPLKKTLTEAVEGADCVAVLTGHDQFKRLNLKKLKVVTKMPAAVVDFEGILEPEKVEMEGFTYRGLGRGVWKK